jgi:hypothetical protein
VCSLAIYMAIFSFVVSRFMFMVSKKEPHLYEIKEGLDLLADDTPTFNFQKNDLKFGLEMGIQTEEKDS